MTDPADSRWATTMPDGEGLRQVLVALLATLDPVLAETHAVRLITAFGSMGAINGASRGRLVGCVGQAAADLLLAHRAVMRWALREPAVRGPIMATRYEVVEYLRHCMAHDAAESLRVFFLNARRELLAEEEVARGGPDGVLVEPRVILARALELGATGLFLVHNHPSGDPTPSLADGRFTRALATAGGFLGIRLHDHLIVARDGHLSVVP